MTKFSKSLLIATAAATVFAVAQAPLAQAQSVADFYKGKSVNVLVGFGPGGGYDLTARIMSRHFGNHIPGKPSVIVQNVVGAGGVRAANQVYSVLAKDGLSIAALNQAMAMYQMLGGEGAQYDATKLEWLGSLGYSNNVAYTWNGSIALKSIEEAKTKEVLVGASGITSDGEIYPRVLNEIFGTKFKIISGYTGTNETNLAIERGELHGRGGGSYAGLQTMRPDWVQENKITILVQVGTEREHELPNVPLLTDLAQTEEQKQVAALVTMPVAIGYNYWLAPGVPVDRLTALRSGFMATMQDAAFIGEMKKGGFEVRAKSGAQLQALVASVATTPAPVLAKTKAVLGW